MIAAILTAIILGKLGQSNAGARRFLQWALGNQDGTTDLDAMPRDWHDRLAAGDARAVINELALGTGEHLTAARLSAITTPTRILHGDRSQPTFIASARRTNNRVTHAELIPIANAGHAVHLHHPHRIVNAVRPTRPDQRS